MYVILVYDAEVKRSPKILKYLRAHLNWVQRSVFEGEITESQFIKIKGRLKKIIKDDDSIYIYKNKFDNIIERETIGKAFGSTENIL